MSEQQSRGRDFEERLLVRLKAAVAERGAAAAGSEAAAPVSAGRRWRCPARLALVGAAALAVAAVVLVFSSGGDNPSKAFAVEPQKGGGVTIKVYGLEDASGLEKALEDAGVKSQVTWLPPGMTCREPHFTPSTAKSSLGGTIGAMTISGPAPAVTIGIMSPKQQRRRMRELRHGEISASEVREVIPNISLDPAGLRSDQTVILFGSPLPHGGDPEGGFQAHFAIAEGPVEPCTPVTTAAGNISAIGIPPGAEASGAPAEAPPGPGQFLYMKTKVVELQGWEPDGPGTGSRKRPRHFSANIHGGDALPALVPTTKEVWIAPDGRTRVRETLGRIRFLSGADQKRWEDAGSPPPFAYDPAEHHVRRDDSGRPLKQYASRYWRGRHVFSNLPKLSRLPADPEALRLAIENRRAGSAPAAASPAGSRRGSVTAERLMEILAEPIAGAALRAAAVKALAELPGIGLEHGVADVAGRRGDALTWDRERGFGRELIFDPHTYEVLAEAETIFGPPSTGEFGVPAGTPFRETAYLQSGVVGSTHETAAEARNDPVATTGSAGRE